MGVVGPHDLVDRVASICEEQPNVRVERYAYAHESNAPVIVEEHTPDVDAWLFTGVIPYTLAGQVLLRPAAYVDYMGATLLKALVQLLRQGHDTTHLSIDTLTSTDVNEVLTEAEIPTAGVHTMAFRPGTTSRALVEFHRAHADRGAAAITCVSTVYDQLRDEMTILRLVPSLHSIRIAVRQLLLMTTNQVNEDSQVALGIVQTTPSCSELDEDIRAEAGSLAGTTVRYADDQVLLVTTRGRLASATDQFTSAPMLRRLTAARGEAHIGFGIGRSAAEAETLARRALGRAGHYGPFCAVASFRNDTDIVLETDGLGEPGPETLDQAGIGVVAARVGLSSQTVQRLHEITESVADGVLTTRDIAGHLGIQQRSARRIVQRLELAGLAERAGRFSSGSSGRPLTLYRLRV